jgi:hypothetical protein
VQAYKFSFYTNIVNTNPSIAAVEFQQECRHRNWQSSSTEILSTQTQLSLLFIHGTTNNVKLIAEIYYAKHLHDFYGAEG